MSFDVFISYSTCDSALANAVKQALQAEGVRCWKAPEDVIPDSNTHYAAQIVEAIERCPVMVLIWSVSSMESLEVSKELSVAMDAKTTVIPFRTEDIKPEGSFKYHLQGVHWLDMFDKPLENALQDLYSQVSANLEAKRLIREKRMQKAREDSGGQRPNPDLGDINSGPASAGKQLNSCLAKWKEALWWLARNGALRSVDRAALVQIALEADLDIDIDTQISSLNRDLSLFTQAILDIMSSGSIDTLSAIGLDSIRVKSCISAKEAEAVMSELWQSNIIVEDEVDVSWIIAAYDRVHSIECLQLPRLEGDCETSSPDCSHAEETDAAFEEANADNGQASPLHPTTAGKSSHTVTHETKLQKGIDEILGLDDSDIEALGVWHESLWKDMSWDDLIVERLGSFRRPSDIMQVFPYIKEPRERKATSAHEIPFGSVGRLLLKSNDNSLLIFDECLSVKKFWEKAKQYSFYDRPSETKLQAGINQLGRGFSLTLSRTRHENLGDKAGDSLTFDNLYEWTKADGESLFVNLPGLVKLLAAKQEHKWDSICTLHMIQELLSLHMAIKVDTCLNLLGIAELANDKKLASNAAESICSGSVDPAELLMVVDKSTFGNCKSGIALSARGIHRKETLIAKYFIPWKEVEDIFLTDDNQLCVNNESLIAFPAIKEADAQTYPSDNDEDLPASWASAAACFFFACAEIFAGQELKDKDSLYRLTWDLAVQAFDADWAQLALALFKRSCSAQIASGRDHDHTIGMIALCLWEVGRFSECAALRMRLYENSVTQNGIDHSETCGVAYLLAEALSADDRRRDAIPFRRRELAWCRKEKGNTDPSTLTSINELAIDLRETGELEEAEALFRELLIGRQQVLESSDSGIGRALAGLAKTLEAANKLAEAAGFARQCLDHRIAHEGHDSFIANHDRFDLARILYKLDRHPEALTLLDDLQTSLNAYTEQDDDDRELLSDAADLRGLIEAKP